MILDSRTDIEEYFLEAFYEMKTEFKINSSRSHLHDKEKSSSLSKISHRTLKIRQFSHQQRELLLKLVFSKINNKHKAVNWRKILTLHNHSTSFY